MDKKFYLYSLIPIYNIIHFYKNNTEYNLIGTIINASIASVQILFLIQLISFLTFN